MYIYKCTIKYLPILNVFIPRNAGCNNAPGVSNNVTVCDSPSFDCIGIIDSLHVTIWFYYQNQHFNYSFSFILR